MRDEFRAYRVTGVEPRAGREFGDFMAWALKRVSALIGLVFVIVGLPLLVTPIPLGLIMIVIGVVLLLRSSDTAKRVFFKWSRTYPLTSEHVRKFLRRRRGRT